MKVVLNTSFITLNEYIKAERTNKFISAKIKQEMTDKICFLTKSQNIILENCLYDLNFIWYKPNNRQDHDNISFAKKFILDGFVKAGIIPNDSPKYIRNFKDEFFVDTSRPYVSCIVYFEKV